MIMKIPRKETLVQQTVEAMKMMIVRGEIASPLRPSAFVLLPPTYPS